MLVTHIKARNWNATRTIQSHTHLISGCTNNSLCNIRLTCGIHHHTYLCALVVIDIITKLNSRQGFRDRWLLLYAKCIFTIKGTHLQIGAVNISFFSCTGNLFHATSFDTGVLFLLYGFHGLLLTNLSWKQPQNLQPLSTNYPMLTSVTINMHNCAFFSILYIYTWSDNNNVFLENSKDVISSGREVYLRCTFQSCPDRGDTTAN